MGWIAFAVTLGTAAGLACGPDRPSFKEACEARCDQLRRCKPLVHDCEIVFACETQDDPCQREFTEWYLCWADAPCEQPVGEPKLCEVERLAIVECKGQGPMYGTSSSGSAGSSDSSASSSSEGG
jgi:hypothetical protein